MTWWDVPFGYRALLAVAFLGLVSGIELWIRPTRATRWRASLLLIGAGAGGAALGLAIDSVTARISRDYFTVGKELGESEELWWRIGLLGIEAGSCAGVVVGCVYLWANYSQPPRPPLLTMALVRELRHPILGAVVCGLVAGLSAWLVLPGFLDHAKARSFLTVWGIHSGLYLGGLAGVLAGFRRIRRYRREPER